MDFYNSKLILEAQEPTSLQPILDKWDEIAANRSLLKVFVPLSKGQTAQDYWSSFGPEIPHQDEGFFTIDKPIQDLPKPTRLEASFMQKGWQPYIGYRRISLMLPGVKITVADVNLNSWEMSFLNGEIIGNSCIGDLTLFPFEFSRRSLTEETIRENFPWIPLSAEEAKRHPFKCDYYYDLKENRLTGFLEE